MNRLYEPILDKQKILKQFAYLTKRFDLDLYLRISNTGPTGLYQDSKKLITLNQYKPTTNFWEDESKYVSWTFVLCHEIRHAIQNKWGMIVDDYVLMERRFLGKLVFKEGDPYDFNRYINFPYEIDANKFADKWEKRLERLKI